MNATSEDRVLALRHLARVVRVLQDGSPFADDPPDPTVFAMAESLSAPPGEFAALMDLLRFAPTEAEYRAAGTDDVEIGEAIPQYLPAYVVRHPADFAPIAEELVEDQRTGDLIIGIFSGLNAYSFSSPNTEPLLSALRLYARPPWDEDRVLGVLGGLSGTRSEEALRLLDRVQSELPPDESFRLWAEQTREEIRRNMARKG